MRFFAWKRLLLVAMWQTLFFWKIVWIVSRTRIICILWRTHKKIFFSRPPSLWKSDCKGPPTIRRKFSLSLNFWKVEHTQKSNTWTYVEFMPCLQYQEKGKLQNIDKQRKFSLPTNTETLCFLTNIEKTDSSKNTENCRKLVAMNQSSGKISVVGGKFF